ncbi:MAG: SH3 domain-containing protein [Spirochaetes bacterium]|nr:SH3 domain-containing protein [Spirochaetota bacterium]
MLKKLSYLIFAAAVIFSACGTDSGGVVLIKVGLRKIATQKNIKNNWVTVVQRGQSVKVIKETTGWLKVELPDGETRGWVKAIYIHRGKKKIIKFSSKTRVYDQPDVNSRLRKTLLIGEKVIVLAEKGKKWMKVSYKHNKYYAKGWVLSKKFVKSMDQDEIKDKKIYEQYISGFGNCKIHASSTYTSGGGYSYSVKNLFDGDPGTTWQEAVSGDGVGEWIEIIFPDTSSAKIDIINGFVKQDKKYGDLYVLNNRIKSMRVEFQRVDGVKQTVVLRFEDNTREFQDAGTYTDVKKIRFIIDSVYKSVKWEKAKTRWNDTAIGEIKIRNIQ